jgi:hypothetical protein
VALMINRQSSHIIIIKLQMSHGASIVHPLYVQGDFCLTDDNNKKSSQRSMLRTALDFKLCFRVHGGGFSTQPEFACCHPYARVGSASSRKMTYLHCSRSQGHTLVAKAHSCLDPSPCSGRRPPSMSRREDLTTMSSTQRQLKESGTIWHLRRATSSSC